MSNPWAELRDFAPFVAAGDLSAIERFNATARLDHVLHLELLPEPYLGSFDAPLVLLSLNPGFSVSDAEVHADPIFRRRSRANLRGEASDYPFFLLAPDITAPGRRWWEQKLKHPIARTSRETVARRVLCVEHIGYHSRRYAHGKLALPSQEFGFELVRRAMARKALIVLMRSRKLWENTIPELANYPRRIELSNPQNPTVSPATCGGRFDDVVEALGR